MKRLTIVVFVLTLIWGLIAEANTDKIELRSIPIDLQDKARLQRGAQLFMNYCSGCHSLRYMRYNRMAMDLGLTTFDGELDEDLLINNLVFTKAPIHDPIDISMPGVDARQWFGIEPPDLSLVARKRGASWLFTYLTGFYEDKKRPFGTNNLLIPGVAMPDVLFPLRGRVLALTEDHRVQSLLQVKEGELTPQAFLSAVEDLVTFLVYVGEPVKLIRYRLGGFVLTFLCILLFFVYRLKKYYWQKLPL